MTGIIFDMDGVIVDSEPLHFEVEAQLFRRLKIEVPEYEHVSFMGLSAHRMFATLKAKYGLSQDIQALVKMERELFLSRLKSEPFALMEGLRETVSYCADRGMAIAVASSSPLDLIDVVLDLGDLTRYFPVRVSGDDVSESKPSPEIFLETARRMNREVHDCWVIEDSRNGVAAAKGAGMGCIAFARPEAPKQDLSAADHCAGNFAEVRKIIEQIAGADSI